MNTTLKELILSSDKESNNLALMICQEEINKAITSLIKDYAGVIIDEIIESWLTINNKSINIKRLESKIKMNKNDDSSISINIYEVINTESNESLYLDHFTILQNSDFNYDNIKDVTLELLKSIAYE